MSRPQLVSRADLLRLLAKQPDASLLVAAPLAGYQPEEQQLNVQSEELVYETAPAVTEEQYPTEPLFWHLAKRESLSIRPSLKPIPEEQSLPVKLRQVQVLRAQELQFPDFEEIQAPALSPRYRQSKQKKLLQEVHNAARLRTLPLQEPEDISQRLERLSPPALALALLRQHEILERSQRDWLQHFLLRLARTWFERPKDAELIRYITRLLDLLPDSLRKQQDGAALLYGIAHRDALRVGAIIPQEYRAETVVSIIQQPLSNSEWLLIQEGLALFLVNSPDSDICLLKGSRLAALQLRADILLLHRGEISATAPVQTIAPLCVVNRAENIHLQTQSETLFIQPCARPVWATLIGRNSRDLFAELYWLERSCRLYWQIPVADGSGRWQNYGGPVDMDCFGLTACISFQSKVMQWFRWLEPGYFFMGSPVDEPEREIWGKETRHQVRLRKGFWLADTAVTQELWQVVMQENPATFQGSDHPVDRVSWEDVQLFLQRLNVLLPGLNARLPTEAEWEYACRAGSTDAFAFGKNITPEQVNYNGQFSCSSGAKGLFRRCTVPVRSLPANDWGLYEMHGNLWEWCQDWWLDDLETDAVLDPKGPDEGEFKAVRGGSWVLGGKGVRSAVRGKFAPDFRSDRIGFRLARDQEFVEQKIAVVHETERAETKKSGGRLLNWLWRWRK